MALRPITLIGADVLRQKALRVPHFGAELHELLDDMLETMIDAGGVGLAAPQVSLNQQVIIVRLPDDRDSVRRYGEQAGVLYEAVNPKIVRVSHNRVDGVEGCLSIPGYLGTVSRHDMVVVRAQDRHGRALHVKAYGWLARVFQHEIDHLNGVLFIDHAKDVWQLRETHAEIMLA